MTKDYDISQAFALLIEVASEEASTLISLINGDISIKINNSKQISTNRNIHRAQGCINMSLAKQFIFNTRRAMRLCQEIPSEKFPTSSKEEFLNSLAPLVAVRDVNEHGLDSKNVKPKTRPSLHIHESGRFAVEETAMIIAGPDKILMGPLNLVDMMRVVWKMREIAGFHTLKRD